MHKKIVLTLAIALIVVVSWIVWRRVQEQQQHISVRAMIDTVTARGWPKSKVKLMWDTPGTVHPAVKQDTIEWDTAKVKVPIQINGFFDTLPWVEVFYNQKWNKNMLSVVDRSHSRILAMTDTLSNQFIIHDSAATIVAMARAIRSLIYPKYQFKIDWSEQINKSQLIAPKITKYKSRHKVIVFDSLEIYNDSGIKDTMHYVYKYDRPEILDTLKRKDSL